MSFVRLTLSLSLIVLKWSLQIPVFGIRSVGKLVEDMVLLNVTH